VEHHETRQQKFGSTAKILPRTCVSESKLKKIVETQRSEAQASTSTAKVRVTSTNERSVHKQTRTIDCLVAERMGGTFGNAIAGAVGLRKQMGTVDA